MTDKQDLYAEAVGAGGVQALSAAPAVPHMSAAEVKNLPAHARAYIHQLASLCDPAGLVRENAQLLDTNNALQKMYRSAADACADVLGCFAAAEIEGLKDALSDTADERLKDLVERRLMYAMYAAQAIAASPTPPALSAVQSHELDDDACRCEPSDYVRPPDYDGDGSVEAMARRAALAASPTPPAEQQACDTQLFKFYGVSTTAELIAAQARHIEKLQAKLPPTPSFAPQRVREG